MGLRVPPAVCHCHCHCHFHYLKITQSRTHAQHTHRTLVEEVVHLMPRVVDRTVRVVDAAGGVADVVLRAAPRQVPVRISRRALLVAGATGQERAVRERRVRPHAGGRVGLRGNYVESGEREGEWGERVHRVAARAARKGWTGAFEILFHLPRTGGWWGTSSASCL